MIVEPLKAIGLYCKNDTCNVVRLKGQTEWECGARVAQYMQNFTEWIEQNGDGETIIRRMTRGIAYEQKKQHDLATDSRRKLRDTLRNGKLLHGG